MPTSDDHAFLTRFERCQLDPAEFNHQSHLRIAWIYLNRYDLTAANTRICQGIQRFAGHVGATEKFHHTLTEALVRIVAHRLKQGSTSDFDDFLATNSDLLIDARGVLARYYSEAVLNSEQARHHWVEPDRIAIE